MNDKSILIIEDELKFAKIVKMRLEANGYEVDVAGDAYNGTKKIIQEDYNVIILDLGMPAGGGFSILDRIRKIPSKADIPVIILTGQTIDDDMMERVREYDVTAVLNKPLEDNLLLDLLRSTLQRGEHISVFG